MLAATLSFVASLIVAVLVAWWTSTLTVRRDRKADWRKLRLATYQEYIAALSGIVVGRATDDASKIRADARYADASNSMLLVAPAAVLNALWNFLEETSKRDEDRSAERHDKLLNVLIAAMRSDVSDGKDAGKLNAPFSLRSVPTKSAVAPSTDSPAVP